MLNLIVSIIRHNTYIIYYRYIHTDLIMSKDIKYLNIIYYYSDSAYIPCTIILYAYGLSSMQVGIRCRYVRVLMQLNRTRPSLQPFKHIDLRTCIFTVLKIFRRHFCFHNIYNSYSLLVLIIFIVRNLLLSQICHTVSLCIKNIR